MALAALLLAPLPAPATPAPEDEWIYQRLRQLASDRTRDRARAARELVSSEDPRLILPLVELLFFTPRAAREQVLAVLETLAGERRESYRDWVEWLGGRPELQPPAGFLEWKGELFSAIDPRYQQVFAPGAPVRIRLEEVISGGVGLDGIPSLDDPPHVGVSDAGYLLDEERVFGVVLGDEARAYPLRILSWHEMVNDTLGGEPVTLSYCTLCGSGILFRAHSVEAGALTFGTSGLLYRSNKLMFDRQTLTLWSNLTGEAVVGALAAAPESLEMLPMTLTTWGAWRRRHPDTRVLALERQRGQRYGYDYRPGAADRHRAGVSFPIWQRSDRLPDDEEVFVLRIGDRAMAYPLAALAAAGLVHHTVDGVSLLLLAEPGSGSVRAYRIGSHRFRRHEGPDELVDAEGRRWRVTEVALIVASPGDGDPASAPPPLPRQVGHHAFWFGWYAFFPDTGVWEGEDEPASRSR